MVKKSALFFVLAVIVLYLALTYSYAGYAPGPDFPEETRFRKLISIPGGYVLQTDSVADRAIEKIV
jgi:hypothetical protein